MAFEVTTYTDVVAREAIDGVDGFNFQSASPGVTGVDQQKIRESMLHRVLPSWALEHDPLTHPPTCAYVVHDGRFYMSRGKSTGDTNSGRSGNQITQAIITSDPDDFVPYRPAQLYGASEWTLEKAPGSTAGAWVTPLEIRPEFEVAALEALVAKDEWAASVLPYYLTMIDAAIAAEPKKLVLIHDDLDVVMQWIALGTLLVDADAARVLQFRALVDDPWRADAALVGVSPDFGRSELSAANVMDLTQQLLPNIEPSDSACVRATWFLTQGADDALNAIEIARRWEPSLGAALANDAARVVGLPNAVTPAEVAWRISMASTEKLAVAGLRDDLALYAEELSEAIVTYGPATSEEFSLAGRAIRSSHDLDVDELASEILVPTLEALTAVPESIEAFAREISETSIPVRWQSLASREAASAFVGELMMTAPVGALPALFAAARVVAAPVAEPTLSTEIQRLATAWANEPELGRTSWQHWVAAHAVLERTIQALAESLRSGDPATLDALIAGGWDFIGPHAEAFNLHGWFRAAKLARVPVDDRNDQAGLLTPLPVEAWRVVLAGSSVPSHARLWATWITRHGLPADLSARLKAAIDRALDGDPNVSGGVHSGSWHPLMDSLKTSTDRDLADIAGDYSRARTAFKQLQDEIRARPGASIDGWLPYLGRLTPLLLPNVGWLLLNSSNSSEVERLFAASSPWGPEAIRTSILDLVARKHALRAIEDALRLRAEPVADIASAADGVLAEIFSAQPKLTELAKNQLRLRGQMEDYLRQQSRVHGGKRGLGGRFTRNREK